MNFLNLDVYKTKAHILDLCMERNVSVTDLQTALGTTYQAVYAWLYGKNFPSIDNLIRLAQYLGTTVDELLVLYPEESVSFRDRE